MSNLIHLEPLEKALRSLETGIERAERERADDMLRDSVIQRFEYTFELCWRLLRRRLEMDVATPQRIAAMSYREMIREGAARGLVARPVAWFRYRDKRNLTSHTYDEEVAKEVYRAALSFLDDAKSLFAALKKRNDA